MKKMLGEDAKAFYDTFSEPEYVGMRINTLKKGALDAVKSVCGELEPVLWCNNGYYVNKEIISGKHPYHMAGLVYFQEPSAMAAVSALTIKPGDFVLDLCASPGGKATQAAEKLCGEGVLVANEIIEKRSKILAENIMRMGVKNAVVTNETPSRLSEKYTAFFDKIIVDAPCSGEGMFKKTPAAITEWSVEHTYSCAKRQKKILAEAVKMLKGGGSMVYSTCTFAPCENEGVIDWLLSTYPELELINIELDGLCDANGEWVNSKFDLSAAKRVFPHVSKGEGHFVALFHKKGDEKADLQMQKTSQLADIYRNFEKENLNIKLCGNVISFGERLYLLPQGINIDNIKTPLAGLFLGTVKKGRFEPSYALCLALSAKDFKRSKETDDAEKYFRGETQKTDIQGWTAVTYKGYPIGFGKGADGILKNHFPKYLRF
ncbi:MAG: RsmF rRNA methyltransferase first C-terminal domain-containing protein [Firmicutes bacterium]|nr:RsmF rRNA methyltransferase first C-terminal domain-containing protein [Bacillota bacterium]